MPGMSRSPPPTRASGVPEAGRPESSGPSRRARRGGALMYVLLALVVIGISWMLVARQSARFAGARAVREIASQLHPPALGAPVRVALIRESGSASYFDDPGELDEILRRWATELRALGAEPSIISAARVSDALGHDVIAIPASPCIGPATRRAVDAQLAAGRGVLLTWLAGVRDGGCRETGWQMVVGLTGAQRADTLGAARDAYLTIPAGGPLAFDIPPGSRIELLVANHVALRAPLRDAYWSDLMLNPRPAMGSTLLDAGVVHAARGAGRIVYWGFDLSRIAASEWNRGLARLLLRNSVAWAAGRPMGTIEAWPRGARVAAVIAQDVEDEFANGRFALDSLRAAGVRGTFFLVSDLAREHPELVKEMAKHGEIATHSENHQLLGGLPDSVQRRRLASSQDALQQLTGRRVAGLRPPEEQYDASTLEAWAAAGGLYVFASNNARTASPEIVSAGNARLVLLGRTSNDDFISVRRLGGDDPKILAGEYLAAYTKAKAIGGLYLLSYHSQMLSTKALVPTVGTVARALAADREAWMTTAGEVARWWMARSGVRVTPSLRNGALEVRIANEGALTVTAPVIAIALPAGMRVASTSEGALLRARPEMARVLLDALAPGQTRTITLRAGGAKGARDAD